MATLSFDEEEVISDINIVPFVDIVLVLLIIVMVTSTALVKATSNPARVPSRSIEVSNISPAPRDSIFRAQATASSPVGSRPP